MAQKSIKEAIVLGYFLTIFLLVAGSVGKSQFQITADVHDQRRPAIYDNIVVWQDNRNGNWDIYGFNLVEQEEFQITTDLSDQEYPVIHTGIVVWLDSKDGYHIYGYNLSTKTAFKIPVSTEIRGGPAIYKDMVVWEAINGHGHHIYGYNLSTETEFQISTGSGDEFDPEIHNNMVVWEDTSGDYDAVCGYDISTSSGFQVGRSLIYPEEDQIDPVVYNDTVVWIEGYYERVYGYKISQSERITIEEISMRECYTSSDFWVSTVKPAIYDEKVVWVDCRNGNRDIYGYNLSTHEEFQITSHESSQQSPALYKDVVIWEDNRNGNWDIYGSYFSAGVPVARTFRRNLILSDSLFFLVMIVPPLFIATVGGKTIWDAYRLDYPPEGVPWSQAHINDFKKDDFSLVWPLVGMAMFGLTSLLLFFSTAVVGGVYLLATGVSFAGIFCTRRIPYIRTTDEELLIFSVFLAPVRMTVGDIQRIDFFKTEGKVRLTLPDKVRVIDINLLDDDGKKTLSPG